MKRFRYIFFAVLLAMMWLGINVYADEYDGLDFDYGSVLVQLKPQITDAVSMCSDPFEELNISDAKCIFGDDTSSISLFSDKTEPIIYVLDLENPSRENVIDTIEKLKAMPNIEYAEPNYNVYEFSEPNDTYYQNGKQAVLDLIGAKKLWDFDIDCSDVTVGVMDSGIQTNHEDLIDNIWVNTGEIAGDGIDNDGNGYIDDIYGWNCGDSNGDVSYVDEHGVHVAGIISAATNNSKGVASVARNAKIASIKIFNSSGKSTLSYIIEGINFAKKNDINIINCSFGGAGWGSTSVSIYTNKLGRYDVCNENTATPTPDNGNSNNNNNNNNGSGNWTPGVIVPPNSNTNKVKFTDIAGHWAENEIRELAKEGIINGRSETEFVPEDTMTRARKLPAKCSDQPGRDGEGDRERIPGKERSGRCDSGRDQLHRQRRDCSMGTRVYRQSGNVRAHQRDGRRQLCPQREYDPGTRLCCHLPTDQIAYSFFQ